MYIYHPNWLMRIGELLRSLKLELLCAFQTKVRTHIQSDNFLKILKMAKKGGYYAVQRGRNTGVYSNWDDCKAQVDGFRGARFKRFDTLGESQAFARGLGINSKSNSSFGTVPVTTLNDAKGLSGHFKNESRNRGSFLGRNDANASFRVSKPRGYYSVKSSNSQVSGRVFDNWTDCQKYVKGQKGVSFKKFDNPNDAQNFMNGVAKSEVDFGHIGITEKDFISKYKICGKGVKYEKESRVYCDGSALANGTAQSRAGFGVYFQDEQDLDISEPLKSGAQTNNRAELQAVSSCLDTIWRNVTESEDKRNYQIKTDSEYVAKLLNDRYSSISSEKLASLPNADIAVDLIRNFARVKQFYKINEQLFSNKGEFRIEWVKGHAGEEGNEKADQLAKAGALKR